MFATLLMFRLTIVIRNGKGGLEMEREISSNKKTCPTLVEPSTVIAVFRTLPDGRGNKFEWKEKN